MTTDHVALAVIHGTTPQIEAGTEQNPMTPEGKGKGKRSFEMPASREERIEAVKVLATKLLKGKSAGKGFKVGECVLTESTKAKVWFYFALLDAKGNEPEAYSLTDKDAGIDGMEKVLIEAEANDEVTKVRPEVQLCYRSEYWEGNKPKTKKTMKSAADAAPAKDAKSPKASKKATIAAAF